MPSSWTRQPQNLTGHSFRIFAMTLLTLYWFTFERIASPTALNLGCGVTAYDLDDALSILRESVFTGIELPRITQQIESVDVSTLDPKHVLPNMGLVTERGVWFPKTS
jgi:hypothetical protein